MATDEELDLSNTEIGGILKAAAEFVKAKKDGTMSREKAVKIGLQIFGRLPLDAQARLVSIKFGGELEAMNEVLEPGPILAALSQCLCARRMKVTRVSPLTGIEHTMDLPVSEAQMEELAKPRGTRRLIQEIFPLLSQSEREFLMTGYTQEDWDNMFPPEDE